MSILTHASTLNAPVESSDQTTHSESSIGDDEGDPEPANAHTPELNKTYDERLLIKEMSQIFSAYAPQGSVIDYRDDCAALSTEQLPRHAEMLFTTDAICEGVHFDLAWDSYRQVGAQAAVVNLSDLASSGARPQALLWSLSLPERVSYEEVQEVARGFGEIAGQWSCPVIGGNLCVRSGPLEIHVTAIGSPERQTLTRVGAHIGDAIYVTGTLGDRALGYLDPTPETRELRHQWRPHLSEAYALSQWGHVSAMLDISDGLLVDLERLAQVSQVSASITRTLIPLSDKVRAHPLGERAALEGGEDYVLLFTAPPDISPPPAAHATLIGHCEARRDNVPLLMLDGHPCSGRGHLYHLNLSSRSE